jgi:vacuolar protein sorting-associated protein 13B
MSDEWIQSEPIYISSDIKRTISNSYALPIEGSINITLHHNSESMLLVISSTCEGKLRFISVATLIVIANHTERELKVFPFCAEVGEKVEALRRNEFPAGNCYDLYDNRKSDKFKKGNPISTFTNISFKSKKKFNSSMVNFIAFGVSEKNNFTCPIKIQPTIRKCLNVSNENDSFSINISILKHEEQFFVSIFNDPHPVLSVKNNTDFNLFVAQTDMKNPSAKYILPHKEIGDEKWLSWFQVVPSKQKVFYTPPTLNEHFPEIVNPDYGLIFACVCGDEFIRWSLPIKIDETKKIIINVPMFGDLKLLVDVRSKTSEITINYIDADEGFVDDVS